MTGEGLDERREDSSLDHLVVEDLSLGWKISFVGNGSVSIGELSSNSTVLHRDVSRCTVERVRRTDSNGDGSRSSKNHSSVLNNAGSDVGHRSVGELGVRRLGVDSGVDVDLGVSSEEVDVRNLDLVQLRNRNRQRCRKSARGGRLTRSVPLSVME